MREVMKFNFFPKEVHKAWIGSLQFTEWSCCHHIVQLEAQRQERLKPVLSPWQTYGETMVSPSHHSPEARPRAAVTWNIASAGEPSWEGPLAIARSAGVSPAGASLRRGVTVNPTRVQQSGAKPHKCLRQHYLGKAICSPGLCAVSAVSREDCAKGPCLPRPRSMSVLHQSLQFLWVKKTGCLEVILPVF